MYSAMPDLYGYLPARRASPPVDRYQTRHRASTSMYSLTFCVRWERPPPSTASHRQASHGHFPYTARNSENAPVTRQSPASSARRPRPDGRSPYVVISRDGRKLVTRVRVMLP